MGAFQQLGLILWKNIILRKRHPGIFFLELIWPILIFVTVALVRLAAPPTEIHRCYYAPRAMPSAGGFQFLQSFACNLDNQCFPDEEAASKTKGNTRMADFLGNTAAFTRDIDKTDQLLKDIPKAVNMLTSLQKSLDTSEFKKILDANLTIGDFMKDRKAVRHKLVFELAVLPGEVVDSILNSSINITQLSEISGNIDFKKIVCDPKELQQYIFIRGNVTAEEISRQLCDIDNDLIPEIVTIIQEQLDVVSIIKMISKLKQAMGEYTDGMMLEDITTMLEIMQNSSLIQQFLSLDGALNIHETAQWIMDVIQFIQKLTKVEDQTFSYTSLQALMYGLDPIITRFISNESWYQDMKKGLGQLLVALDMFKGASRMINDFEATLNNTLRDDSGLLLLLKNDMNLTSKSLNQLLSMPLDLSKVPEFVAAATYHKNDLEQVFCNKPGLISIYNMSNVDTKTKQMLHDFQDNICKMNLTNMNLDFVEMFNFTKILEVRANDLDDILKNFDWGELYEVGKNLFGDLQKFSEWLSPLINLGQLDFQKMWDSLRQTINGLNTFNDITKLSDLDSFLQSYSWLPSLFSAQSNDRMTAIVHSYILDIMYTATENYKGFPAMFTELLKYNLPLRQFIGQLLQNDEMFVTAVIPALIRSDAMELIMNNPEEFLEKMACNQAYLENFFSLIPGSRINVTIVESLLCNRNLTNVLQTIIKQFNVDDIEYDIQQLKGILDGSINMSSSLYDERGDTMAQYNRTLEFWNLVQEADSQYSQYDWSQITDMLYLEGIETDRASTALFMKLLKKSMQSIIVQNMFTTLGPVLEDSEIFPSLRPIMRTSIACGEYVGSLVTFAKDTMSEKTETGRFLGTELEAFPDMIDLLTVAMQNVTFAKELVTVGVNFCNDSIDRSLHPIMLRPSVRKLRTMLCGNQWAPGIVAEWNDIADGWMKCEQSAMSFLYQPGDMMNNMTVTNLTMKLMPIDWEKAFQVSNDLYVDFSSLISKENSFKVNNMHRIYEALGNFSEIWHNTTLLGSLNGLAYSELAGLEVLQQFLPDNNPTWNKIKYYGNAVNDMMKGYTEILSNYKESGISLEDIVRNSTQLRILLDKHTAALPGLMTAIQSAMVHPDKLMHILLTSDLTQKTVCKDLKLTDILSFDDEALAQEFEDAICGLNINVLLAELMTIPAIQDYNIAMQKLISVNMTVAANFNGPMNWTDLFENYTNLTSVISQMNFNQSSMMPIIPGLNITEMEGMIADMGVMLQNFDIGSIMNMYQGLDAMGPFLKNMANADPKFTAAYMAIHATIVQNNAYINMLNAQLTKLIGANVSISELLPSEELQKVFKVSSSSPEVLEVLLNGLISIVANPSMLNTLPKTYMNICMDSAVFAEYFPVSPNSSTDPTKVQEAVCTSLTVNWTLVANQLVQNVDGLAEYINVVTQAYLLNGLKDYPLNISSLIQNFMTYQSLSTAISNNPPNIMFGDMTMVVDGIDWNGMMEKFITQMTKISQQYNYGNIANMLPYWQEILVGIEANSTALAEVNNVLSGMAQIMEGLTVLQDVSLLFSGHPHLEKLISWQRQLPDIVATLVLSSVDKTKFAAIRTIMQTNISQICTLADIQQYLTLPPNVRLDFNDMKDKLCNTAALYSELMEWIGPYQSVDVQLNLTETFLRLMRAQTELTTILSKNLTRQLELFPWLQMSAWDSSFKSILPMLPNMAGDPATTALSMYFATMQQLTTLDMFNTPEMNALVHMSQAIIETTTAFLNKSTGRMLRLPELFPDDPELQKLLEFSLQMPDIYGILIASYETAQFQKLLTYNFTTAAFTICHPLHDPADYFTVPNGLDLNLNDFKTEFCAINISALMTEIYASETLNIEYILEQKQNTSPVNWTEFGKAQDVLTVTYMNFMKKPLVLIPDGPLFNGTAWIKALTSQQQSPDIATQFLTSYKTFISLLPKEGSQPVVMATAVLHSITKSVITYMSKLPKENITLADLVDNNKLLLDYLMLSYKAPTELVEGMLHAAINKPDILLNFLIDLVKSGNPLEFYCNYTIKDLTDMFQFPPDIDLSSAYNLECKVNTTALSYEAMNMIGIGEIILKLQTAIASGNFSSYEFNETALLLDNQKLLLELEKIIKNDNFRAPEMNYETVTSLYNELVAKYSSLDTTESMMELYGTLLNIISKATGTDYTLGQYFHIKKLLMDYVTNLLKKVDIKDQTIELSSLLRDVPQLSDLMHTVLNSSTDLSAILSKTKVDINKLGDLLTMDQSTLVTLLCSPTQLEQYFTFPKELDVDKLSESLCGINTTQLLQGLTNVFKFDRLFGEVISAWQNPAPLNTEEFIQSYSELVNETMRFIYVTKANLFDSDVISSHENFTEVWKTLTGMTPTDPSQLSSYLSYLEMLDHTLNGTSQWTYIKATLTGAQMFMDVLTGKIKQWPLSGLTIRDVLVNASYTSDYLQGTFAVAPDVIEALLSAQIDWAQFFGNQSPGYLCSDAVVYPSDVDVDAIRTAVCDLNVTQFVQELVNLFNWPLIKYEFSKAAQDMNYQMNWTSYLMSITDLQATMNQFFMSSNSTDISAFFEYSGDFNTWLARLQEAFRLPADLNVNNTAALIDSSFKSFVSGLNKVLGDVDSASIMVPLINTATEITSTLRKWISTLFKGNTFSLSNILGDSSEATTILQSALHLEPEVIEALLNAEMSQDLYWMLMGNLNSVTDLLCNETVLVEHFKLAPDAHVSFTTLQQSLCNMNVTVLLYQLQQVWDISALLNQFASFSNLQYGVNSANGVDTAALINEWKKLVELAGPMFQQPITIDKELLNFSNFSALFEKILQQDMTGIMIQSMQSGFISSLAYLPKEISDQLTSILTITYDQLEIIADTGLTFDELINNGTALSILITKLVEYPMMQPQDRSFYNTSTVPLGADFFALYQTLKDRGYLSVTIHPNTMLSLLQNTDISAYAMEQLSKYFGTSDWYKELQDNINMIGGFAKYFNNIMERAMEGNSFNWEKVVPRVESLRKLLTVALDPDSTELFLLMGIKPSMLTATLDQPTFIKMVCDPEQFKEIFNSSVLSLYNSTKIQQTTCGAAQNGTLMIQQILDMLDISLIYKQLNQGSKNVTWMDYIGQMETLIKNFQHLMMMPKTESTNLLNWLGELSQLGMDLGLDANKTAFSYVAPCNEMVNVLEDLYPDKIVSTLLMLQFETNVSLLIAQAAGELENLVCALPSLNLTQLVGFWETSKMAEITKMFNDLYDGKYRKDSFDCASYIPTANNLIQEFTEIQETLPKLWNGITKCLSDVPSSNIPVLSQLSSMLSLLREGHQLITTSPDLLALIPNDMAPWFDKIVKIFLEQKPTLMKLEKLWADTINITDSLSDLLGISPHIIKQILASSIDLNKLPLTNITESMMEKLICDPESLDNLMSLVDGIPLNASAISDLICGFNFNTTLKFLLESVNLGSVLTELFNDAPEYTFSVTWLSEFASSVNILMKDLLSAFKLTEIMNNLDQFNLIEVLGTLQDFLDKNSPQQIFDDIDGILDQLKSVLPTDGGSRNIIYELKKIAAGIQSLNILKKLPLDAPIHTLIKDPSALKTYMVSTLNVSTEAVDAFLNSSILFQKFAEINAIDVKSIVCTPEELSMLLLFKPATNVTMVSHHLCNLNEDEVTMILDYIIQNLDVGEFIRDFVITQPETILENAGLTKEEVMKIANNFKPFQGQFKGMISGFNNLTTDIDFTAINEALTGWQSGTGASVGAAALNILGDTLCDRQAAFGVEDSYRIKDRASSGSPNRRRRKRDTTERTLSNYDKRQMEELGTPFCKDLYLAIKDLENGHIIWTYMKPLIRGKILYSPMTTQTQSLMMEATKMLRDIMDMKDLLHTLSTSLHSTFKQGNLTDYTLLQKTLQNPFIAGAITETLGFEVSFLVNDLDSLTSMTPDNIDKIISITDLAYNIIACMGKHRLWSYESEEDLEEDAAILGRTNNILAGVVFMNIDTINKKEKATTEGLPKHIKYKIRMDIENVAKTDDIADNIWTPKPADDFAMDLRYLRGFIELQDMIDGAIIKQQSGRNDTMPAVQIKQFPYPCHNKDDFQTYSSTYFLPIIMFLAWLVAIASAIHSNVYDREKRLEETMKIMGLRSGVNWTGWFLNALIGMLIMSFVIVLILKLGKLMPNGNPILIWIFLADFSLSMTMFCYMISSFFTRTTLASLSGVICYFISYLPFIVVVALSAQLQFWHSVLLCLSATTAFSYGSQMMTRRELEGPGIQWSNAQLVDWNFSFDWCCYMMLIDAAIYAIIGWYVRNVFPGKYGVAQPWYFCILPRYWCGCCVNSDSESRYLAKNQGKDGVEKNAGIGEPDPSNLPVGISIHGLTKIFKKRGKKNQVAVDNLTVNFYKGQVTAFLGENGAGKTTTINMLTGYTRPTSGWAFIEGKDINKDATQIRQDLGICPQQDVLFDYLTVYEHLDMFVNLKGKGKKKAKKEEKHKMLQMAGLESCIHSCVSKLSGGQRRRLSVVLAFIGGSRVIILDEPTTGVDPCARRAIWDLIIQNREDRTILLCTHHLDEADLLGDRLVMMHKGKMICSGSPLYLKTHYGSGYQLTISKPQPTLIKNNEDNESTLPRTSTSATEILKFVQQHVHDAFISEEVGMEVTIVLPTDMGQLSNFQQLFADIDSNLETLCISSYGVSDTSLEEVFLKLIHQSNKNELFDEKSLKSLTLKGHRNSEHDRDSGVSEGTASTSSKQSPSSSLQADMEYPSKFDASVSMTTKKRVKAGLLSYRFGALFMKRLHHHRRDIRSYFSHIFLPIIFMCVAMGCALVKPQAKDQETLLLSPGLYGPETNMFFRMEEYSSWNAKYASTLLDEVGIATTCMADSDMLSTCDKPVDQAFHTPAVKNQSLYAKPGKCKCSNGFEVCPKGAGGYPTPRMTTQAGNYLHNITGSQFDTPQYLVKTHNDFLHKRFGGWSFDLDSNNSEEVTVWWDNKGWHALPSFYNSLSNMVLRASIEDDSNQYGISVYNHPFHLNKKQLSEQLLMQGVAETGIALCILCAFCFVPAGYSIFLIHERVTKEKRLQFVYGVGLGLYWFTAFVWDMLAYLFTVALAIAIAAAFQLPTYTAQLNLPALAVSLIMFGWAAIPSVYLLVRRFKSPATGYMMTFLINLMIGVTTTACIFLLSLFLYIENVKKAYKILSWVFLIFPQFCLGDSLIRLSRNQFLTDINMRFNKDTYVSPFTFEMILWHFVALAVEGFVFMILHLILESRPCQKARNTKLAVTAVQSGLDSINRKKMDPSYKEDEDVSLERQRVMIGEARDDLLVLYNLKKEFKKGSHNITAVDNLTLGIPRGECFGLLGVNGAGKTTTFNMMTGEIVPTAGAALLEGKLISENTPDMHRHVGYCPQDDALDPNLSVREMLICYGKLKGLHSDGIDQVVKNVIHVMGLTKYTNMTVKSLSGGSKRKLSTALALLGDPDLLLMDEPTSGMDPQTRRLVWNMIISIIKNKRSVLLTSHSMDECEAICTRLSIMVNGHFMCLGSRQHIQHRFGRGYVVTINTQAHVRNFTPIIDHMLSVFSGAVLKDQHLNRLELEIPHTTAKLSDIFGALESSRNQLNIQDYSVSQSSLDKVFISFARQQHDGLEEGVAAQQALDAEQGYTNPAYDTWEQRPASVAKILPHMTLADDPIEHAAGLNPQQPDTLVAQPQFSEPQLSSVINVGEPHGDMGSTTVVHL